MAQRARPWLLAALVVLLGVSRGHAARLPRQERAAPRRRGAAALLLLGLARRAGVRAQLPPPQDAPMGAGPKSTWPRIGRPSGGRQRRVWASERAPGGRLNRYPDAVASAFRTLSGATEAWEQHGDRRVARRAMPAGTIFV